jgi:hypothetical protein
MVAVSDGFIQINSRGSLEFFGETVDVTRMLDRLSRLDLILIKQADFVGFLVEIEAAERSDEWLSMSDELYEDM